MGRRKIEIQPITHERNRSVTFLKRKNGLFKKAYELGVLCSVDVAVIIFEERPGHHVKLYQYCSGNIDEIAQRHSRYDGEKDTRTPHDFINHSNTKHDDVIEGEDDEPEDEDPEPALARGDGIMKRGGNTVPKIEPGVTVKQSPNGSNGISMPNMDYLVQRTVTSPSAPLPTAIPISGERQSTARMSSAGGMQNGGHNKKHRLVPGVTSDQWSQEDIGRPVSGSGYGYHPVSVPPAYRSPPQSSPYFPGSTATQAFTSENGFDYHPRGQFRPMNCAGRSMPTYNQQADAQQFRRVATQQYQQQQHSYQPLASPHQQHQHQPQRTGDIFAAILDGEPRQQGGSGFGSIDWPVHSPAQGGRPEQGDPNDASWLDFLSGPPAPSSGLMQASPPLPESGREGVSWQRDGPATVNGTISLEPASRSPSLESSPKVKSNKRSRAASALDDRSANELMEDDMTPPASGRKGNKAPRIGHVDIERDIHIKRDEDL
ncbi:hypothetical protein PILCRDRAFT_603306 [Piloderma croceum F 1598]|uniref:MADS-box domain-containing protein n=1 Tax=Piloderma croceum (strain F 1598) TaxID=765440 RepID=A0A0C3FDX0_PILCF|nr:hypothetical protein PILCRDRAFT_603306 [Piloderma croceum F 1598]